MSKRIKENGQIKKAERRAKKEGLNSYYTMVERVPLEGKKYRYTKLVSVNKAAEMLYGKLNKVGVIVKSSREYKLR